MTPEEICAKLVVLRKQLRQIQLHMADLELQIREFNADYSRLAERYRPPGQEKQS